MYFLRWTFWTLPGDSLWYCFWGVKFGLNNNKFQEEISIVFFSFLSKKYSPDEKFESQKHLVITQHWAVLLMWHSGMWCWECGHWGQTNLGVDPGSLPLWRSADSRTFLSLICICTREIKLTSRFVFQMKHELGVKDVKWCLVHKCSGSGGRNNGC